MGLTNNRNNITGRYPTNSQAEITIGDGVSSSGMYTVGSAYTSPNVQTIGSTGGAHSAIKAVGDVVYLVYRDVSVGTVRFRKSLNRGFDWSPAIDIDTGATIQDIHIAVKDSNVYVVHNDGSNVKFLRSTDGGLNWESDVVLEAGATKPFICVQDTGPNVYVSFASSTGNGRFMRSTTEGASFSAATTVEASGLVTETTVAAAGAHVYATYSRSAGTFLTVYRNTASGSGAFALAHQVTDSAGARVPFSVASSTYYYLIFFEYDTSRLSLLRSNDSGATFDPIVILDNTGTSLSHSIGVDGTNVAVSYRLQPANELRLIQSGDFGVTWGASIELDDSGSYTSPAVAVLGSEAVVSYTNVGSATALKIYKSETERSRTFSDCLTHAVADLLSSGGTIRVLPGSFTLDGNVEILKDNISVIGSGYVTEVDTGAYRILVGVSEDRSNVNLDDIRFVTSSGPCLVFGDDISIATTVTSGATRDNWFEPSVTPPTDPNTTPASVEALFKLDEAASPYASAVNATTYRANAVFSPVQSAGAIGYTGDFSQLFAGSEMLYLSDTTPALTRPITESSTQAFTIEAFIYPTTSGDQETIYSQRGADDLGVMSLTKTASETVRLFLGNDAGTSIYVTTTTTISAEWTFVTATYDGSGNVSGMRIFFNGQEQPIVATGTTITGTWASSTVAAIGASYNSATISIVGANNGANYTSFFTGYLDNLILHDSYLTASQARDRYLSLTSTLDVYEASTSGFIANGNISSTGRSGL